MYRGAKCEESLHAGGKNAQFHFSLTLLWHFQNSLAKLAALLVAYLPGNTYTLNLTRPIGATYFAYWLIFSDTFTCLHISVHILDESKRYLYITLLLPPKRYLFTILLIPIVPPQQHSLAIPIVPRCYCRVQEKFRHFSKNKGHSARCSGKKKRKLYRASNARIFT